MTASLIASLLLPYNRCVPKAPPVPPLRTSHMMTASPIALLERVSGAPSVPSLRLSHGGVAHGLPRSARRLNDQLALRIRAFRASCFNVDSGSNDGASTDADAADIA